MYDTIIKQNPGIILPLLTSDLLTEIESRLEDAGFIGKLETARTLYDLADAEASVLQAATYCGVRLEDEHERTLKTAVFLATRFALLYPERRNIWLETARVMCGVEPQFIIN